LHLQTFTIEGWLKRASSSIVSHGSGGNGTIFGYGPGGYFFGIGGSGFLFFSQLGNPSAINGPTISDTNFHHVALTEAGGTVTFYIDGVASQPQTYNATFNFTGGPAIGYRPDNADNSFNGTIDELSIYSRALSAAEIQQIYNIGSGGKCFMPVPPAITTQPTNQTVSVGQSASFSVAATSTYPLSYQWNFNGTNLPGATNTVLTLNSVQLANAGLYSVKISTPFTSTNSSSVLLTVKDTLDHFTWNPITSPKFAHHPFTVVIEAMDSSNELYTNFNGTINLYDTNGIPITPSISGNFIHGSWTNKVTISQPVTNLVMKADDGAGHVGLANAINVFAVPNLGFTASGNFLLIYWPVSASNFILETSSALAPPQWFELPNPPLQIGDEYLESIPMTGTNQFYQLLYIGN
jgi:hypothetical protein